MALSGGAYTKEVLRRLDDTTTKQQALDILAQLKDDLLHGRLKINEATGK
jgi:hypothetical protein